MSWQQHEGRQHTHDVALLWRAATPQAEHGGTVTVYSTCRGRAFSFNLIFMNMVSAMYSIALPKLTALRVSTSKVLDI